MFTVFLAGCPEDGTTCVPLESHVMFFSDLPSCEAALDAALITQTADWPVISAACIRADPGLALGIAGQAGGISGDRNFMNWRGV